MSFIEIFDPGARFWREQRDREKMLIVEDAQGGSGPKPLDLDSGEVILQMPARQDSDEEEPADSADGSNGPVS